MESELGCRYSCLLQLPYFDPVQMLSIDPMHNMYLGTTKHIYLNVWIKMEKVSASAIQIINEESRISTISVPPNVHFEQLTSFNGLL